MRQRISGWICVGVLALLAGCGGGGSGSSPGPQPTPPAATPDTTPAPFQFSKVADAERGSMVTSNLVTISGLDVAVPVTIENGEYAIDSGTFTSAAGTVSNGQSLTVRARVSTNFSKVTRVRLTVGSTSTDFEVTSEVPDYTPDLIVYDDQDIIYLLNNSYGLVFRWSISEERYLDAFAVGANGVGPTKMAYSTAHQLLYLGYESGAIHSIGASSGTETPFASTGMRLDALVAVGNYVLAQDASGAWQTQYVFNRDGAVTDQHDWNYYSAEYAWDPATSRVYFFRDDTSPNDLHYEVIDQATGTIAGGGETPYHGSYNIQPPIRVSPDGRYVLLGSGDIYNGADLTWSGSVSPITDGRWFANGSLVALTTAGGQTTLRRVGDHLGTNGTTLEQLTYAGQGLRVVGTDAKMAVVVIDNGAVRLHSYVPSEDSDGDGVINTQDAFPVDAAASVDSDRDGYPDAWNPGRGQNDSTSGLSLDAYPQDAACYLGSHGNGITCNYAATVPNYVPDQVVQQGDTVYLLSSANRRVYRWSIAIGEYLNPYVVGIDRGFTRIAPIMMAYSSDHRRLYLGYSTGAIQYIDVSSGSTAEVPFANTALAVQGLAAVGKYVLAQDGSGAWARHYVFDRDGAVRDQPDWNYYSREYAWDPVTSRVYFFRDSMSPNDLHYEVIDQTSGLITSEGETPYHGSYSIQTPIRVSASGQYVLLGSGDIYNQSDLTWAGSLGFQLTDARWFANGSLVTLSTASNQTTLRRLSTSRLTVEQLTFSGQALRVVGTDTRMAVLVAHTGTVEFHIYEPADDSDGDGVANTEDAFPLDAAASVDSDRDGYPDAWNPGRGPSDSTTGLSLDAYPQDSACYLGSHGDGVTCDYSAALPDYIPDQVINQVDTVYLLSSANRRVYRWSIATGEYLNPYVVGINQGFSTLAPTKMTYSSNHQRLYLGYSTGAIQYIDVSSTSVAEVPFANTAMGVEGLAAVGNYVLAQDGSGAWATHYVFDANGIATDRQDWNYYSREYAWDPVTSRVYFFRDDQSPNDLHYEVIDQTNGRITSEGETPYHGSYNVYPPIRVSPDGQRILLGGGDIYNQADLTRYATLGKFIQDAHWRDHLLIDLDAFDRVEIRDADTRAVLRSYPHTGHPLRLVFGQEQAYLVHVVNNDTAFVRLPFGDQDQDSLPQWWEELYGLSDSNDADALGDPDGDAVSNAQEYLNRTNPLVAD